MLRRWFLQARHVLHTAAFFGLKRRLRPRKFSGHISMARSSFFSVWGGGKKCGFIYLVFLLSKVTFSNTPKRWVGHQSPTATFEVQGSCNNSQVICQSSARDYLELGENLIFLGAMHPTSKPPNLPIGATDGMKDTTSIQLHRGFAPLNLELGPLPRRGILHLSQRFHYTGWLIGMLLMVHYNPYLYMNGKYNPLHSLNKQVFFIAHLHPQSLASFYPNNDGSQVVSNFL